MIKFSLSAKIATLALTSIVGLVPMNSARANIFDEEKVIQDHFIAVAQPFGENRYNLLVIEQLPGRNTCWQETESNSVDLLLINFDFSGHCRRSTDANGYSVRYNGNDLGLDVILMVIENDGVLDLVGINRRENTRMRIGSVEMINDQPMKITLKDGWQFSKRSYQGTTLGHVYFSYTTPPESEQVDMTPDEDDSMMDTNGTSMDNENSVEETIIDITAPSVDEDNQSLETPKIRNLVVNQPRMEQRNSGSYNIFQSRLNR